MEGLFLHPVHRYHRSQSIECVTYLPEQLLPISPVCTPIKGEGWGEGDAPLSPPTHQRRGHPLPTGAVVAIRCDHDGLKMAEVQEGHLVLRAKHHGQTHVKVIPLSKLLRESQRRGG